MIVPQRHLFDIPEELSYLNCAYMSPLMHSVVDACIEGAKRKARPWEISPGDFFNQGEGLGTLAAKLFHCTANDVAIVPSASYGLQTATLNLPLASGQKLLVLAEQFASNFYPWHKLARERNAEIITVPRPEDSDWSDAVLHTLTTDVAIAALPHVQWTSGGLLDLEKIGATCRTNGTAL